MEDKKKNKGMVKDTKKTKDDDLYDYELQPWDRDEWGRSWCKWCYKPWIYGKKTIKN